MKRFIGFGEGLGWNHLPLSARYLRPFFAITATTELRVVVPQVDLESLRARAPHATNAYASEAVAQLTTELRTALFQPSWAPSLGIERAEDLFEMQANTMAPVAVVDLALEGFRRAVERQATEHPQGIPLFQKPGDWLPAVHLANETESLPMSSNAFSEVSPPVGRKARIGLLLEELSQGIREREEQLEAVLTRATEGLSRLITPPPRWARGAVPVRTRGKLLRRGAVRTHGGPGAGEAQLDGIILNEAWEPEQSLSLTVEAGPEIHDGRLTLTVRGKGTELVGRRADLLLESEWVEIVLGSSEIRGIEDEDEWALAFDLELVSKGLKVRDGTLPPRVLQVVIEPSSALSPTWEPTESDREDEHG